MKTVFLAAILIWIFPAFAAKSGVQIFSCKVVSFDRTEVKGHCDPEHPERVMKIPRKWLSSADDKLNVNALVHVPLNADEVRQWLAMNGGKGAKK